MKLLLLFSLMAVILLLAAGSVVYGDEGMWLFNHLPREYLKNKYDFDATTEWLEHVQKASVRFNSGGSGSFVSPDGLVMTNHHVGADCLQKISDEKHNYLRDGFHARTRAEEHKCTDLELNVLKHRGRDRSRQGGGQGGHVAGQGVCCATRRHGRDRERIARKDR